MGVNFARLLECVGSHSSSPGWSVEMWKDCLWSCTSWRVLFLLFSWPFWLFLHLCTLSYLFLLFDLQFFGQNRLKWFGLPQSKQVWPLFHGLDSGSFAFSTAFAVKASFRPAISWSIICVVSC